MLQQQREDAIAQAYLIAVWHPNRTRRLPKLAKVLEDSRPKRPEPPQTPEQMLEIVKAMHAELVRGG